MVGIEELKSPRCRGRGKGGKAPEGSRRVVVLTDGSELKWWKGEFIFRSRRMNTKVATTLQWSGMARADVDAREEVVQERYQSEECFAKRMIGIMGYLPYMDAIRFLKGIR